MTRHLVNGLDSARVSLRRPGVEQDYGRRTQHVLDVFCTKPRGPNRVRVKPDRFRCYRFVIDRESLGFPGIYTTVEHGDVHMPNPSQQPPKPCCDGTTGVVIDENLSRVRYAPTTQMRSKTIRVG